MKQQEWRIRKENAGIIDEDPESIFWGLKQALIDPKLYLFIIQQMALITAQSFNNFFPSIVGTLGYGRTTTLLLTSPPYFFAFIVSLCVSFHAAHKDERGYHIAIPMVFALFGNILVRFRSQNFRLSSVETVEVTVSRQCSSTHLVDATSPCSS